MNDNDEVVSFLADAYADAMAKASGKDGVTTALHGEMEESLKIVIRHSESSKGVLTVLVTSLAYKVFHPEQDVRRHQSSIVGGYAGRTFDVKYITPFLKERKFPAMAESGWLTRSLEQKSPYDENYKGAIKPDELKAAFLGILKAVEEGMAEPKALLDYILQALIIQRDKGNISLAIPSNLSIDELSKLLDRHFHARYSATGAARLPVLALYAFYQAYFAEGAGRYRGKTLLPLESHTTADARSGSIGDIEIVDEDGEAFEGVEVKLDVRVSLNIVLNAIEKIVTTPAKRYYILSTLPIVEEDRMRIEEEVRRLKNTHNCQLIINGVMPTLKYYLRLLCDTNSFVRNYAALMQADKAVKFEHRQKWNELVASL